MNTLYSMIGLIISIFVFIICIVGFVRGESPIDSDKYISKSMSRFYGLIALFLSGVAVAYFYRML